MRKVAWEGLDERTVIPGFHGRFLHSERMTFVFWRLEAGAAAPEHNHPHEQVVWVQSGQLDYVVGGVETTMNAGDMLVIPPNVKHSGVAVSEVRALDIFSPVREDYQGSLQRTVLSEALPGR